MLRICRARWVIGAAVLLVAASWLNAQVSSNRKFRRARPPEFDSRKTSGIFFDDVFRQAVEGPRPQSAGVPVAPAGGPPPAPIGVGNSMPPAGNTSGSGWSKLISATTIEDEIKAIKLQVDQSVTTPTQFRSRDYRSCRRHFTLLAVLFGIIEEYDGDVRWKQNAPALTQAFARAAANCKTGSDQAYNEAKLRKLDLQDVIGGATVNLPPGKPREDWEGVGDRSALMQWLEASFQTQLQPNTANQNNFQANQEDLHRQAQLVAAIGRVLKQDGMMDAGDEDYDGFCDAMINPAVSLAEAIKSTNYDAAASAVGQIGQACSGCHELYR